MGWQDDIFDSAEIKDEWSGNGLTYKLYGVPRSALDEDSDEPDALLLHGIDDGRVRRVDVLIDTAYGRWSPDRHTKEQITDALDAAPTDAKDLIGAYVAHA